MTLDFIKLLLPHLEMNYELPLKHTIFICADLVLQILC